MESIMRGLNRIFHGNKRQMLTAAAAVFIVYVLLLSGIFSYFHSEDAVNNRMTAQKGSVTIHEPNWEQTGQYMAANSEPGMNIPKDPVGWNDGSVDVYIRLVMTVETIDQETYVNNCSLPDTADTANGEIGKKTVEERLTAIVERIKYMDGGNAVQFLTLDSSRRIAACANGSFEYEADNKSSESNKLTYYFYYTAGDKDSENSSLMRRVSPNRGTDELFQRVDIPKFKKDYLGVFDFDFSITLTAEAIPVGNNDVMTVSEAITEFADN